jgi:hypothetical protein
MMVEAYDFEPYVVEVELDKGKVLISGGTECNSATFIHTAHQTLATSAFGNIGHLVSRLAGELDSAWIASTCSSVSA